MSNLALKTRAAMILQAGQELKDSTPLSRIPLLAPIVEDACLLIHDMAVQIEKLVPFADEEPTMTPEDRAELEEARAAEQEERDRAAFEEWKAKQAADAEEGAKEPDA